MHQAQRFLDCLTEQHHSGYATYVTIRDGVPGRPLKEAPFASVANTLGALNRTGSDIFVVVNRTDGKGRRAENIVEARACWADYDNGVPKQWLLPPSIVVESSPGKAQAYWLMWEAFLPANDRWLAANRGIAAATGADLNACDTARVLRLPGFANHKYPEMPLVKLLHCTNFHYSLAEIERAWKPLSVPRIAAGGRLVGETIPSDAERERRYAAWLRAAGSPPAAGEGVRSWYFRKAAMGVRDFALEATAVAAQLQEVGTLDYGECLEFALDAERYASGAKGQALQPTIAARIELR